MPGEEYVIRSGDTFESIAKDAYGTLDRWPEIYAKASGVVRSMRDLPAGVRIMIPR